MLSIQTAIANLTLQKNLDIILEIVMSDFAKAAVASIACVFMCVCGSLTEEDFPGAGDGVHSDQEASSPPAHHPGSVGGACGRASWQSVPGSGQLLFSDFWSNK